jgi:hypothetical protein
MRNLRVVEVKVKVDVAAILQWMVIGAVLFLT